ncbi:iron-sulfur cluster carrier protein ApbC [Thaumasiovibrio subtropicus]|uniref:iron-sulfur cluster carrier protein ApbC n=1 Tax=Thaumasiovibrio subtropicus TaxID=1891207 RepID=UPI000B3534E9|nr:iron-sulfur cluster carrier protein ApbC [Thaumasiovibrio subtropicus]
MKFENAAYAKRWLSTFQHALLPDGWANERINVQVDEDSVNVSLPFVSGDIVAQLKAWAIDQGVSLNTSVVVAPLQTSQPRHVKGVRNIIAVSSGKGGVGKSTTAVNLALALQAQGAKVGVLDADIYGPSIPLMLGQLEARPETRDGKMMQPVMAHGLATNSIGYLIDDADAAVWRGPMASKALMQLLNETEWPDVDYLVVDLPPGTGDIQLTLAQQIPVTGAIVVTTPQDLALADVRKGVAMFDKVNVPVLGIIENMSFHVCQKCGHEEAIFGEGGAAALATEHGLKLLADMPLDRRIRADIDAGSPSVVAQPASDLADKYCQLAQQVSALLFWQGKNVPQQISVKEV